MAKRKYANIVTGPVVASYPHIHERDTQGDYPSNKYTITIYLEKGSDEHLELEKLAHVACEAEWPEGLPAGGTWPIKEVLADPNKPDKAHVGDMRVVFKSDSEPSITGPDGKFLPEGTKIKGGDIVRVAGAFASYVHGGNKGVTCYLNAVRLVEKRAVDPFGGADFSSDDEEGSDDEALSKGRQDYNF